MNIKTSTSIFTIGIAFLMTCIFGCCLMSLDINASEIAPAVTDLVVQHDQYVINDDGLTEETRSIFLQESVSLLDAMKMESISKQSFRVLLLPIYERYMAYIDADTVMSELEKRINRRTGEELFNLSS